MCESNNDKAPGSAYGFTAEFHRRFWHLLGKIMVDSFNYAYQVGKLSISQIISLIPKNDKNLEFLKDWRPITLLNTDYKIPIKAIAMRLDEVLPKIIHPCQAGYVNNRYNRYTTPIIQSLTRRIIYKLLISRKNLPTPTAD